MLPYFNYTFRFNFRNILNASLLTLIKLIKVLIFTLIRKLGKMTMGRFVIRSLTLTDVCIRR